MISYPKTPFDVPRCFTPREYYDWKLMMRQSLGRGETLTVCDDCTPAFEAQQRALCRCEKAAWRDFVFGKPEKRCTEGEQHATQH
jgi:thioester reductase-like protein